MPAFLRLNGIRVRATDDDLVNIGKAYSGLTDAEIAEMVDTSDEWIVSRTGIRERRIAAPDEALSDRSTQLDVESLPALIRSVTAIAALARAPST